MKDKSLLILSISFIFSSTISAQSLETVTVKAGTDFSKQISQYGVYRFPSFTTGNYYLYNGANSPLKMNYNFLEGQMQYIDIKGDTMYITNSAQMNFIKINGVTFYCRKGYMEVIADYDTLKLALKRDINISYEKNGALGTIPGYSSAIEDKQYLVTSNGPAGIQIQADINAVIQKKSTWYFLYKEQALKATKDNLQKIFSYKEDKVKDYTKGNKIDFNNEANLKDVIEFLIKN